VRDNVLVRRILVVAVLATLALTSCGRDPVGTRVSQTIGATQFSTFDRVTAPDVNGITLDGASLALRSKRGKVVVLNNWASWCLPCNDEAATLVAVSKKLAEKGVEFLGLDVSDQNASAQKFVETYKIPYPSIVDRSGRILNTLPGVPPEALPSTLIIDRDGKIAVRIVGAVKEPKFTELILAVLAE